MYRTPTWISALLALSLTFAGCGQQETESAFSGQPAESGIGTSADNSAPTASPGQRDGAADSNGQSAGGAEGFAPELSESEASQPDEGNEPLDPDDPDEVEEALQWIQLSTDDSTSMASAQIYKGQGNFYGFGLKAHEFLNYYDPPIALFEGEQFSRTKAVDADIRFGIKAVFTDVEDLNQIDESDETALTPPPNQEGEDARPSSDESQASTEDNTIIGETEVEEEAEPIVGQLEVLFQMQSDAIEPTQRRPWNLFLCVDVSGSMQGEKMAFTIEALRKMLDHLRPGDHLTLTAFNNEAQHIFTGLEFSSNRADIERGIGQLSAGGGTNMSAGLSLSYEAAQAAYDSEMLQRVLLFGDGSANVGHTEMERFNQLTRINGQEGIYLSGIGVGTGYDFERMDQLTDAGKGAHIFLPNREEVDVIFGDYFHKVVEVAADKIAIEVVVPAGIRLAGFSGEEVSFDPNQRLQNIILASGDDMTFTATFDVLDEAVLEDAFTLKVTMRPLSTGEETIRKIEVESLSELLGEPGRLFERTQLINRFGKYAAHRQGDVDALVSDLNSYENPDWGIREILSLLAR
jgi:Mg-chelatase subunit ChlD